MKHSLSIKLYLMPSFLLFEAYFSTMSALYGEIAFDLSSTKVQNYILFFSFCMKMHVKKEKKIFLIKWTGVAAYRSLTYDMK